MEDDERDRQEYCEECKYYDLQAVERCIEEGWTNKVIYDLCRLPQLKKELRGVGTRPHDRGKHTY
jgi:hypothetical protein